MSRGAGGKPQLYCLGQNYKYLISDDTFSSNKANIHWKDANIDSHEKNIETKTEHKTYPRKIHNI